MEQFTPLFQAITAFAAVIGGFSFVVSLIVRPLRVDISRLKKSIEKVESRVGRLENDMQDLKKGQQQILAKLQQA